MRKNGSISKHKANKVKEKHSKVFIYVRQRDEKERGKNVQKIFHLMNNSYICHNFRFNLSMITATDELNGVRMYVRKTDRERKKEEILHNVAHTNKHTDSWVILT